jgi:hypothetical protein
MVRLAAAGYDSEVAGLDEARARSVLADMQDRLARDPGAALGVPATATVEDVRSAFLELTKQFHPVRFGRMAVDVQKMANEVFLSLRAAHDALAKAVRRQSGPIPRPPSLTGPQAAPLPVSSAGAGAGAGSGRTTQPLPPRPPVRPGSPNETGERAPVQPPPTTGPRAVVRPPVPATAARPALARPPAPAAAPPSPPRDENAVIDLLQRQQWDQAKTALHQLQACDPSSKRIKALMSYARGREAQLDGRVDDARVELHDAIDMDPGLQLAKTALTELFTRRK